MRLRGSLEACDAEVEDLEDVVRHAQAGDEEVGGLDVPMQDVAGVCLGEGAADLAREMNDPGSRQRSGRGHESVEVEAFEQLHRDEEHAVVARTEVEDADRVGCFRPLAARASTAREALAKRATRFT